MVWMAPPTVSCSAKVSMRSTHLGEAVHGQACYHGLDLAADVFQVYGVDAKGAIVCRRQLWRSQVPAFSTRLELWLVGMKACAGAHSLLSAGADGGRA